MLTGLSLAGGVAGRSVAFLLPGFGPGGTNVVPLFFPRPFPFAEEPDLEGVEVVLTLEDRLLVTGGSGLTSASVAGSLLEAVETSVGSEMFGGLPCRGSGTWTGWT